MSRAILLLDEMPCACAECPLHTHVSFDYYYNESICMATGNEILNTKEVHRMCPLKEMPKKMAVEDRWHSEEFARGWTACIEEIEK